MCGIAGIAEFTGRPADEQLVRFMCEALRHRGPDDEGVVRLPLGAEAARGGPSAALGNRRLSIIDVQGGHQPVSNEDRTVWAVLNGELYNFQELRRTLTQQGHRFTTRCDTEVIVHLYEKWGEAFVEHLEGMFAIALWDERRKRLILARDRFGQKPLLYADTPGRLAFASEFQALLRDPSVSRDLDPVALDDYLTYLAIPAPRSIYRAVRKVPPAHYLVRDVGGTRLERYWSLHYTPKLNISEAEAGERVVELLTSAVRKRLISDVPLGVLLSGGLDSSVVVALMSQLSGQQVKTFSIGFEEERYNELPHARRVAERFGCDHQEFIVKPQALDVLPTLVERFGEPYADSSAIPTFYLCQMTRQHVTVALSGDGGDEAFAGYRRHLSNRVAEAWRRVPSMVRTPVRWLGECVPNGAHPQGWPARLKRFLRVADMGRVARYQRGFGVFHPELKARLYANELGGHVSDSMVEQFFAEREALDAVDIVLAADTAFYLPTDLLVKMDIMSMANSLEVRSPFLDHTLVEFAARLPSTMKLRGLTSKYLIKQTMADLVPRENLYRKKKGFEAPIGVWFRTELRSFLVDHLHDAESARRGLFRQATINEMVEKHLTGRADYTQHLWTLLMLELWLRSPQGACGAAASVGCDVV